jgi:hypothetical protein
MVVYAVCLPEQVHFACDKRKTYESAPGIHRTFCPDCGTPLSYEAEWQGQVIVGLFVGTLDNPELFPPERHVFDLDRISWFDVADHLPRYHQTPSAKDPIRFGPAIETIPVWMIRKLSKNYLQNSQAHAGARTYSVNHVAGMSIRVSQRRGL